jgi:hypothetical protein
MHILGAFKFGVSFRCGIQRNTFYQSESQTDVLGSLVGLELSFEEDNLVLLFQKTFLPKLLSLKSEGNEQGGAIWSFSSFSMHFLSVHCLYKNVFRDNELFIV